MQSRRNLRSQIEKRSLAINEEFFNAFREVKNVFDDVYNDVAKMSKSVAEMTKRLENTKAQTKNLIDQTNSYQIERYLSVTIKEYLFLISYILQ